MVEGRYGTPTQDDDITHASAQGNFIDVEQALQAKRWYLVLYSKLYRSRSQTRQTPASILLSYFITVMPWSPPVSFAYSSPLVLP